VARQAPSGSRRHPGRGSHVPRPTLTRGIQTVAISESARGGLSRGGHQRPPGVHRPPPRAAAQRGVPFPEPIRSGTSSSATSSAGGSRSTTAAYGSTCVHEHSCVRCPLLRIDPAQRGRLEDIRDNLIARIAKAGRGLDRRGRGTALLRRGTTSPPPARQPRRRHPRRH
jgi:hypothetical protein